jgi:hypothetical protein
VPSCAVSVGFSPRSLGGGALAKPRLLNRRLRFGSCKRSPGKLIVDINHFTGHVTRFLEIFREYRDWQIDHVAIAPQLDAEQRRNFASHDIIPQDLIDRTDGLP